MTIGVGTKRRGKNRKKKRDAEAIEYFFFNYWFISFCTKLNCKNECQSLFNCLVVILQFAYIANNKWEREKKRVFCTVHSRYTHASAIERAIWGGSVILSHPWIPVAIVLIFECRLELLGPMYIRDTVPHVRLCRYHTLFCILFNVSVGWSEFHISIKLARATSNSHTYHWKQNISRTCCFRSFCTRRATMAHSQIETEKKAQQQQNTHRN